MTMNVITTAKADLAEALVDEGIKAEYFIPSRITPPLAIISPDSTYVAQGDTFASFELGVEITLVAQTASNPKAQEELDDAIVTAISAIPASWRINDVAQPFALSTGNAEFLATRMSLTTQITI
jgi:hypothetical protein